MSNFLRVAPLMAVILLLFVCSRILNAEAAYPLKILGIFPHPGMSHFKFFHPLMRGLAEAGHEVTVISPFPDKSPPARYKDLPLAADDILTEVIDLKDFQNPPAFPLLVGFGMLHQWGKETCNKTLRSKAMAEVLKKKNYYNVIIVEQFCSDCMTAIGHVLNAPVIAMSSCPLMPWHYERFGAPIIPSYIPTMFLGNSESMSFFQRLDNWLSFHILKLLHTYLDIPATDALIRYKFGHDMPSVGELVKQTSIMFVNQHYALSGPKPLPPSVIEIGGIHIEKAQPLSPELQKFVDNAEHGVVVISWGSMIRASSMPDATRDGLLRAIRRLKQRFVWKWENETIENKPENLLVTKWLPQRDILCHPNVKVFMTHGGLLGSSEAAYCGVPAVVTPQYGDQYLNAATIIQRGMGVKLLFNDINENTVVKSIKKVLEKQYQDNAKLVAHEYKHRPQTALQTALWWVEHVARSQGAPLMKSSSVFMNPIAYYSVDVYIVLFGIIVLIVISWIWLLRKIFAKKSKTEKSSKKE